MAKYSDFPRLGGISSALGFLISNGESHGNKTAPNYNAYNMRIPTGRMIYNNKGKLIAEAKFPSGAGRNYVDMRVADVRAQYGSGRDKHWAVGRWQITKDPFTEFVNYMHVPADAMFDKHTQDIYVIYGTKYKAKRKDVFAYVSGRSNDIDAAALALAREWSSKPTRDGKSFYKNNGVDKAHVFYKDVIAALHSGRVDYARAARIYAGQDEDLIYWYSLHSGSASIRGEGSGFQKYAGQDSTAKLAETAAVAASINHPVAARVATGTGGGILGGTKVIPAGSRTIQGTLIITGDTHSFKGNDGNFYQFGAVKPHVWKG